MRYKRPVVQLTTLLDLLFIMIFVSLNNTKATEKDVPPPPRPEVAKVEEKVIPKKEEPVTEEPANEPNEVLVSAEFLFYSTPSNPGVPTGSYRMNGLFIRSTGQLQLGGTSWVKQPKGFVIDMVPLSGIIDTNRSVFTGRVEADGCKQFRIQRFSSKPGKEIAGKWQGVYTCLQGETGLTLTIY